MKADLTRDTYRAYKNFSSVVMQQGRVQLDADWNEQAAILLNYLRTLAADLIGPAGGPKGNLGFHLLALPGTPPPSDDFQIGFGRYYVDGILCEVGSESTPYDPGDVSNNVMTVSVAQYTLDGQPFQASQWVQVFDGAEESPTYTTLQVTDVDIGKGTLKLTPPPPQFKDPMLCRAVTYLTQPNYRVPQNGSLAGSSSYLVYLDVWERLVTYVEDDSIREAALGGPDTAARTKVVWQVKAVPGTPEDVSTGQSNNAVITSACDGFTPTGKARLPKVVDANRGWLRARAEQTTASSDPCIIPPQSSYQGPENQLYRVEINRPGKADNKAPSGSTVGATFKWSRENGCVVFPIVNGGSTATVTLETLGRDDRFGLSIGDWVEVQDDTSVLQNTPGNLVQVQSIDTSTLTVTLTAAPGGNVGNDPTKHPLLRRWDQTAGDPAEGGLQLGSDGSALILEDSSIWLALEDGVQIQFVPPEEGNSEYKTGDYWLIPARVATGDVEWPTETAKDSSGKTVTGPIAKPPDGVDHHYAPLGVITMGGENIFVNAGDGDCRREFGPLATLVPKFTIRPLNPIAVNLQQSTPAQQVPLQQAPAQQVTAQQVSPAPASPSQPAKS